MRRAFQVLFIVAAALTAGILPAAAQNQAFCIKGCDFAGEGECSFSSYQQCLATASGRDAYCVPNPSFNANARLQPSQSRVSRRKI
jgi:hypothetical protein